MASPEGHMPGFSQGNHIRKPSAITASANPSYPAETSLQSDNQIQTVHETCQKLRVLTT
jgi:hypothetical protein